MTDTRVLSNQRITVWIGPDSAISDYTAPELVEVEAMLNVSGAINWNSFAFNIQASDSQDDRTLTDGAGAKSRSYSKYGGNIEFVQPKPDDTGSIFKETYDLLKAQRQKVAVVIRTVTLNSVGIAVGDVVNAYHCITDAVATVRGKASYAYTINFVPQDDIGVNCIIPAATPNPVTVTPATPIAATVGTPFFLKATYETNNVTVGATYLSSDAAGLTVTPHGIGIANAAGTYTIHVTYPGSAAGTAITVNAT